MNDTIQPVGIDIENVDLSYGQTRVLRDVSLRIAPGEFFAFLGPSGCGKTTLLRLIAGFNTAQRGRVVIGGKDITALPPWQRDVGLVFQSYALWPHMSVARNVAFGLEERRMGRDEIAARVDEALDLVGLKALKDRKPSQLSGGQQQRVALARTVAIRPKVLLLDEPLSNLDAKMRVSVRRELRELQQALKLTAIFVTHDQEEANTICDRIAVMSEGTVQQVGTPMELYDRPANHFVAQFLGTANFIDVSKLGTVGPADAPPLMFRPQDARLAAVGATASAGQLAIEGRIGFREFLGSILRYSIETPVGPLLVDIPYHAGSPTHQPGEAVSVIVPSTNVIDGARSLEKKKRES